MNRDVEQRRAQRKHANSPMPIVDVMTERVLGQLGNLSATGLMLLGPHAPRSGAVHQVTFMLPGTRQAEHRVEIGIQEQWHEPAAVAGQFWSGYRIVAASDDDVRAIDEWIGPPAD
ncbi:PilZ domain-containing protein [Xanthomonas sp. NCPPB 2632]|jgi:hypothetical protein|uniref:PilZ domain-containing protein n=1 Tax=Xanthomonas sp. NCPPB 2632 TaxID=3240912 RepID=UPI0035189634